MFTIRDTARALTIAESLLEDIDLTQDSQLRRLVDDFDYEKFDSIEELIAQALENPRHEIMMAEMASNIGMGIAAVARTISNDVLGLVDDIYEDLVEEMKRAQSQETAYNIIQRKLPEYLHSDYVVSIGEKYSINPHIRVQAEKGAFPVLTREELIHIIRSNNTEGLSNMIVELLMAYGFDIVTVYDKNFRKSDVKVPAPTEHMTPSFLPYSFLDVIFTYHLADSLLSGDPLETAIMDVNTWTNSLEAIRNNAGMRYGTMLNHIKGIVDRNALIVDISGGDGKDPLTITVDKDVYTATSAKEEIPNFGPMYVLGKALVMHDLMRNTVGVNGDFGLIANDWVKSRQRVNRANEMATSKRRILLLLEKYLNSKEFETDYFASYVNNTARAVTAEQRAGALINIRAEKLELLRKNCSDYTMDSATFEYDCIVYVVAKTFYPHIGAYEQIRLINQMGETGENLDGRQAALLALPETINKWLVKTII